MEKNIMTFAIIPWLESFELGLKLKDFIDVMYSDELGYYAVLQNRFRTQFGEDDWYTLINHFKPHQGNIETYLEDTMQELINDYFN